MNKNNSQRNKPFCKVCFDAGKLPVEYESHYVRSSTGPDSKVICPTLLALNCKYCHETGHTINYCKILTQKKKQEDRMQRYNTFKTAAAHKVETKPKPITNSFMSLDIYNSDSDDEDLSQPSMVVPDVVTFTKSYAAIAAAPVPDYELERAIEQRALKRMIPPPIIEQQMEVQPVRRRWADYSTSEDEDDDLDDDCDW